MDEYEPTAVSTSSNWHISRKAKTRIQELVDDGEFDDVTVKFGDHPSTLTLFFENWQHVADVANQMLGAANIALGEEARRQHEERIDAADESMRQVGWDVT